jgi:hypothetical protein
LQIPKIKGCYNDTMNCSIKLACKTYFTTKEDLNGKIFKKEFIGLIHHYRIPIEILNLLISKHMAILRMAKNNYRTVFLHVLILCNII